jgi:hypothetical protein
MPASSPHPHSGRTVLWHLRGDRARFATEFEGVRKFTGFRRFIGQRGTDVECSGGPFACGVQNGVRKALRAREFVHDRAPFLPR